MMVQGTIYNPSLGLVASHRRAIRPGTEYERFFKGKSQGTDPILAKDASVYDTLDLMEKVVHACHSQVTELARHLQGNSRKKTCQNIFEFMYNHFQYKLDKAGEEQLRTPLRSWADRKSGIDCDCYSIFVACLLTELNIPFAFRIIKLNGRANYQHVYVVVPTMGDAIGDTRTSFLVIDPVLTKFDAEAPGITDKHDKGMSGLGIPVRLLNGLDAVPADAAVLENGLTQSQLVSAANSTAMELTAHLADFTDAQPWATTIPGRKQQLEQRLFKFLKVYRNALIAQGAHLRKDYNLVAFVDLIISNWADPKKRYAAWLAYAEADKRVRAAQQDEKSKSFFQKVGDALGDIAAIPGKVFNWAIDKLDDLWRLIKQVGLLVPRQLIRAAIAVNVLDSGRKLKAGVYDWPQAQAKGYTLAQWKVNHQNTMKVEKVWEKMGGNVGDLRAAIGQGAAPSGIKLGSLGVAEEVAGTAGTGLVASIIMPLLKGTTVLIDKLVPDKKDQDKPSLEEPSQPTSSASSQNSAPAQPAPAPAAADSNMKLLLGLGFLTIVVIALVK